MTTKAEPVLAGWHIHLDHLADGLAGRAQDWQRRTEEQLPAGRTTTGTPHGLSAFRSVSVRFQRGRHCRPRLIGGGPGLYQFQFPGMACRESAARAPIEAASTEAPRHGDSLPVE
jgi:hypothetical protein